MTTYTCRDCGHPFGSTPPAEPVIALHRAVSHSGATPIVETPALDLPTACAIVRADLRRTDLGDSPTPADEAAFTRDYGTDTDIQRHVLDWAYMFEEPDPADLAADEPYARMIAAWRYVMANGTHPAAVQS